MQQCERMGERFTRSAVAILILKFTRTNMCGIAGLWDRGLPEVDALQAQTAAMTQALAHRGPDGNGRG